MFVFNGISSKTMEIVVEEEQHFLAKARRRYNQIDIDGKNGASFEELGYSSIDRPIKIFITNPKKINEILAWLDGEGEFIYNNKKTKARFYNEIEPIRTAGIFTADFSFIRDPFWHLIEDPFLEIKETIYNSGTFYSEPIIRLEKIDEDFVDFTINDIRIKYTFNDESYAEINCEDGNAYYDNLIRNRQIEMGFEYPKIFPGINKLKINNGNAKFMIKRKDAWL